MSKFVTLSSIVLTACLFMTGTRPAFGKERDNTVYAFGFGTCLGDSIVYLTTIQPIDSAKTNRKTGFLIERNAYSAEMEQNLRRKYGQHFTCAVFYDTKKDKLEKQYLKLRKQLARDKSVRLEELPPTDFAFSAVTGSVK